MTNDEMQHSIEALLQFITPVRHETFVKVLQYRTRHIAVMLENIYQPHNASAVLRSSDAFGVQDIHVIEQEKTFKPNQEIAMGSAKWVSIHHHNNIEDAYNNMRTKGYKIIATTVENNPNTLDKFNINEPSILVFGNELNGLSQKALSYADSTMYIPMFGFVESFNISVSVAIILSHIINRLHHSNIEWRLSEQESQEILLTWLRADVHKADKIEQRFSNG